MRFNKLIIVGTVAYAAGVSFSLAGGLVLLDPKLECSFHTYDGGTDWKHTVYVDIDLRKMQYRVGDYKAQNQNDAGGTVVDLKATVAPGPEIVLETARLVPSTVGGASVDVTRQGNGTYFVVNKGDVYTCNLR